MNSRRQTTILLVRFSFALLLCVITIGLLIKGASSNLARATKPVSQLTGQEGGERTLNIERYASEPFELVDLKIGSTSVKNAIKARFRDKGGSGGIDHVKFRENDLWGKKLKIRLRNVSGKVIYGMAASLFFEHYEPRVAFEVRLRRLQHQDLKKQPLNPREEIDLEVDEEAFNQTVTKIAKYGLNPNELLVVLSIRSALFSDDFGWFGGSFMRRDPNNPQKWDAVDKNDEPPEASRLNQSAGFVLIDFKSLAPVPQTLRTCQAAWGGFFGYPCSQDGNCYRVEELGNGTGGHLSDFRLAGTVCAILKKTQRKTALKRQLTRTYYRT